MKRDFSALSASLCAIAGACLYALLAFGVLFPPEHAYYGSDIYNAYFYRLLEGHFDLPMRMLRYEGHYAADGTGVLYHGLAPLLTRALLYPFVSLEQFPTAALSIWLWAVIGTGFYHMSAYKVMQKYARPSSIHSSIIWGTVVALAIWLCGPGLFLSANLVLYHEPISIAYAAMAITVYLLLQCTLFNMPLHRALIPVSLLAGVLLHSRPHMAIGLYTGVVILILLSTFRMPRWPIPSIITCLLILSAFGAAFMYINAARFGSMIEAHGHVGATTETNTIQYGAAFWDPNYANGDTAEAFLDHGTFHPWRIVPNLLIYVFDYPAISDWVSSLHRTVTQDISGFGKVEAPRFGMLFIWPSWIILMLLGLCLGRPRIAGGLTSLPLLAAVGLAAVLMLSFPTVAFRYRTDLWPLIIVLCLLSFPGLMARFGTTYLNNGRVLTLSLLVLLGGILISGRAVIPYAKSYQTSVGGFYGVWDEDICADLARTKGFSSSETLRLCVDPSSVFPKSIN